MRAALFAAVLALVGCGPTTDNAAADPADLDEDGWAGSEDCDDSDPEVNPDAEERCDGIDNNCDGLLDDEWAVDAALWYADSDGDGFGTARLELRACSAPSGHVDNADDCDDTDAEVSPVAAERCDGRDDDCDGAVDEDGAVDAVLWLQDADDDGHADPDAQLLACTAPEGFVRADTALADDCNDLDPAVSPSVDELCNGKDDDCDGTIDEDSATDAPIWYPDADGDGYGDGLFPAAACSAPSDHVAAPGDCDDASRWVNPEAVEVCNGLDDDCDGAVDAFTDGRAASGAVTWYRDDDEDGFPDESLAVVAVACDNPGKAAEAVVGVPLDCDDADATVYPDLDPTDAHYETCNGKDDDCDGVIDGAGADGAVSWYRDADGDGFGLSAIQVGACPSAAPTGYVTDDTDCDDTRASVNPDAAETCNGIDDDCDPTTDEDLVATDTLPWYTDSDGDGFGDAAATAVTACSQPVGLVGNTGDCNDAEPLAWTSADERCGDGVDNDCDGNIDDPTAVDAISWYDDDDGDTYGDPLSVQLSCTALPGTVANSGDCDDTERLAWTGADEVCGDGIDNNCDGDTDDPSSADATTWYLDDDGDGYGGTTIEVSCTQPAGYVADDGDCEDGDSAINPAATELCDVDEVDEDCDGEANEADATGAFTWYIDADGDGYGDIDTTVEACAQPSGYADNDDDCNDGDEDISPAAAEICDGGLTDENCDGAIDESTASNATTWYDDDDGDGFGDPSTTTPACVQPSGFITDNTDCDDTRPLVNPAGTETCNGIDDDCDPSTGETGLVGATTDGGINWTDVTSYFSSSSPPSITISTGSTTLAFCDGTWYPAVEVTGGANLTVVGEGTAANIILSGNNSNQLFDIRGGGTLDISNLRMRDARSSTNGGAVSCSSSVVSLDSIDIDSAVATTYGGALYLSQCTATVSNTDIASGKAASGAGIYSSDSTLTLTDTTIDSSVASNDGGALWADGVGVERVGWTGGGAMSNSASRGGAVYASGLSELALDGVELSSNFAATAGGAVFLNQVPLVMDDSLFQSNFAVSGGAVYAGAASSVDCTSSDTSQSHGFLSNAATFYGTHAYLASVSETIDSTDCDWDSNTNPSANDDIYSQPTGLGFNYANNVTFACTSGVCAP